ncbi:MAG: YpiB family protein [Sporolactobacillus sp.]
MEQMVTSAQKKVFIKWLIEQRIIESRETIWLLNYLRSNERLLNIVHFVESIEERSRAMMICCKASRVSDFEYTKLSVRTNDPEKAFHDLRLNQDDPVYIKIQLEAVQLSAEYFAVLEDNQDAPTGSIHDIYGKAVDDAMGTAERAYAESFLYEQINEALDNGEKEKFLELSSRWKALKDSRR